MTGILVVDKPAGFTSFDVVAKLRGILQTRKLGHGGTLDPMATGVLPVFAGPALKAVDLQPRQDKCYEALIRLGVATDTGDVTGEVLETGPINATDDKIKEAIAEFVGESSQIPPMYSAVKVDGKPLYRYAREGKAVERKARPITVHEALFLERVAPDAFRARIHCSKGTYIRVLAEDLGRALGTCATLAALRRTRAGVFTLDDAHGFAEIEAAKESGDLDALFSPVERVFEEIPRLPLPQEALHRLANGAPVYGLSAAPGVYRGQVNGAFIGLVEMNDAGLLGGKKLFIER